MVGTSLASLRIVSGLCVLFHFGTMFSSAELAALPVPAKKERKDFRQQQSRIEKNEALALATAGVVRQ